MRHPQQINFLQFIYVWRRLLMNMGLKNDNIQYSLWIVQRAIRANILNAFGQRRQFSNLSSVYYTNLETFTIKFSPCKMIKLTILLHIALSACKPKVRFHHDKWHVRVTDPDSCRPVLVIFWPIYPKPIFYS